jgi:hypothetical protein
MSKAASAYYEKGDLFDPEDIIVPEKGQFKKHKLPDVFVYVFWRKFEVREVIFSHE